MSQLHSEDGEMCLPVPTEGQDLLRELSQDGAGVRETWTTLSSLASKTDLTVQTVREYLQWLATNGYIRHTSVEGGEIITVTETGRSQIDVPPQSRISLQGYVSDGKGEGKHFVSLEGYTRQFQRRLGYEPYPGTLNVDLTTETVDRLHAIPSIPINQWADGNSTYGAARCYPAQVETTDGAVYVTTHVLVPERTTHDETTLEIIAPVELRSTLDITTEENLTIHV